MFPICALDIYVIDVHTYDICVSRARLIRFWARRPKHCCGHRASAWSILVLKRPGKTSATATFYLQQPLAGLVSAGVLTRRKDGNRVYFQANAECPFLGELQGLLAKTVGLVDVVRDALSPVEARILVAFIYGSVAKSCEQASSDVDLLVVADVGLSDLSPLLDVAEERLGRAVNANVCSPGTL